MIPTRAMVLLAAIPLCIAGFAVAWPSLTPAVVALDVALALLAALDALLTRAPVDARREFAPIQAIQKPFDVVLTLSTHGRAALHVRVTDDAPGSPEGLPIAAVLRPGVETRLTYTARIARRGAHPFGPVCVRVRSPLGLWERQVDLPVEGAVRVYPDFAQLRTYGLIARRDEDRRPVRARRRPGGENEFERLRPYVPGDPYRHIDWRATARRGEFITREFGQEVNQNVLLLLDCGRMMGAWNPARDPRHGTTSFDLALNAALMMGQVALRHGDRVGLLAFDHQIRAWLPPRGGARNGSRLIRATYDVFPSYGEPDYALAFRHLSAHVRRRSLVVLFTAVADEPNAALADTLVRALAGRHLPVCVWVRDTAVHDLAEAPHADADGLYARAAAAELVGWRERSLADARRRGALVIDAPGDELTSRLIARYLEVKARRLL